MLKMFAGAPAIPPATVVILGAGVVGMTAAMAALNRGAHIRVSLFLTALGHYRRVRDEIREFVLTLPEALTDA